MDKRVKREAERKLICALDVDATVIIRDSDISHYGMKALLESICRHHRNSASFPAPSRLRFRTVRHRNKIYVTRVE